MYIYIIDIVQRTGIYTIRDVGNLIELARFCLFIYSPIFMLRIIFRKYVLIMKRIIKDRHEYFQIRLNSGNEFAKAGSHLSCGVVINVNNIRIEWIFVLDKDTSRSEFPTIFLQYNKSCTIIFRTI